MKYYKVLPLLILFLLFLFFSCVSYVTRSPRLGVSSIEEAHIVVTRMDNEGGVIDIGINTQTVALRLGNGQTGMYEITTAGIHRIRARYALSYAKSGEGFYAWSSPLEFTINDDIHYYTVRRGPSGSVELLFDKTVSRDSVANNMNIQQNRIPVQHNDIVSALNNATRDIMSSLQDRDLRNARIAIVNISSSDSEQSELVVNLLEHILVQNRFTVVDRSELDRIRREQNFQLSGEVADDQIVSIGRFARADIVITGNISGTGTMRHLRLRGLDTESAEVVGSAFELF